MRYKILDAKGDVGAHYPLHDGNCLGVVALCRGV